MNKKAETKLLYNVFQKDIDRVMEFEVSTLSLAELLNSGVMDGMSPQELLQDIVDEWYHLTATHYTLNSEDRDGMIKCIEGIEKSLMVDPK
jgi:hypothetical protein